MKVANEKSQAQGEWRNKEERRNSSDGNRVSWFGFPRRNSECQPLAPDRDDRTGGNSSSDVITAITGGILEQLILESKDELTNSEARVNQLHDRIKLLESLQASLEK